MSSSSRLFGDSDNSKLDLPVFISPNELNFALNKKRSILTIFNPYDTEAQFRIMTTNPDRFDVSVIKGIIKSKRRIDVTIRLLNQKIEDLPQPTEELETIDYFRVTLQVGQLKGNKPIKVNWSLNADLFEPEENQVHLLSGSADDTKHSKLKVKSMKTSSFSNQRCSLIRPGRQIDYSVGSSNINLICTLCALACVIGLLLPLTIDTEKPKSYQDQASTTWISQISAIFSISYEMKLGCSFALGLFTYRLISTLPD